MTEAAIIVDRKGLAKKLANRPKAFIIYELLQNAWDEPGVTRVVVKVNMMPARPICAISVEDDSPDGFQDLASVYTMFRDSKKAPDPTKRGRFEMGEKLVLALAIRAQVTSTTGTVTFNGDERTQSRARRERGTLFEGSFRITRDELVELDKAVKMLEGPAGIETTFNGHKLTPRVVEHSFETTLQTVKSDEEGQLSTTQRKTEVRVYAVREGEVGYIFEMGIPVVPTGDPWHYDVQQRVPVNWERDNVPPAYLRTLRVEVLNAMHTRMTPEMAAQPWVTDAIDDKRCSGDAVTSVVKDRFGEKAVIYDPSDAEGTKIAMSQGYTVIPGGAFSKEAWRNIRAAEAALPAGQVTPSPRPYDPEGHPEKVIPREEWTPYMHARAEFSSDLFTKLTSENCYVVIVNEPQVNWAANFGPGGPLGFRLCLNYGRLGKSWFALPNRDETVLDLLLHEYVHHTVEDHLSDEMHKTATRLGARLTNLALNEPEFFT